MSGGHVLVIEDDEWVARLLAVGLREAGHRVTLCADGAGGITTIHREAPDCVVCDVELPDVDGFAIGRSMRQAGGLISGTPLVYLCARDEDADSKLEALRNGGDAYLSKPFRIDEVALTVTALIRLAERNRGLSVDGTVTPSRPPTPAPAPPETPDGVLEGDLAKVSVATVLTVLEMEKHSGQLEMTNGEHTAQLHMQSGSIDEAHLDEVPAEPILVLRTVLTWMGGRFRFVPTKKPERKMTGRATIGALLMEAARLEDEHRAGIQPRDSEEQDRQSAPPSGRLTDMLGFAFGSIPAPAPVESPAVAQPVTEPPPSLLSHMPSEQPSSRPAPPPRLMPPPGSPPPPRPATSSLIDDAWESDDDAAPSLEPVEIVKRGPPPVPPPRPTTAPTPPDVKALQQAALQAAAKAGQVGDKR